MDSSNSNYSSFDPLTSLSSFPTFIIYPFDHLSPPHQSLGCLSPDPLFASFNCDSFETSDFSSSLGNSLSGYGNSLLNFTSSPPPNDFNMALSLRSKSPIMPFLCEPGNMTSIPSHMSFQNILDAIQSNAPTNFSDSYHSKLNSASYSSNAFNTTPIPSVYTLLKIDGQDTTTNINKITEEKTYFSASLGDSLFNDSIKSKEEKHEKQHRKFTLLKKKPAPLKHSRKDAKSILGNYEINSKSDSNYSNKILKYDKKILPTTTNKTPLDANTSNVVRIKNPTVRPVVDINDKQHVLINGEKRWKCKICEKTYSAKHNLVTHMLGHDGIKPYSCSTCGRCFKQLSHLNTHTLTHGAIKKHKCDVCNSSFLQASHLRRHMKLHGEKSFKCNTCELVFSLKDELNDHLSFSACCKNEYVKQNIKKNDSKLKKYTCVDCGKRFLYLSHLRSHVIIHSEVRPFICTECGQEFNKKHHLKSHVLTHSGIRPFSCRACSRTFSQKSNLIRHKLTHSAEKKFKCNVCQQSFQQQQVLNMHAIRHRAIMPYKCQSCGKMFSRLHSLKAHSNLHKDSKPHNCICGAAFTLKCNLTRHLRDKNCHQLMKNNQRCGAAEARKEDAEDAETNQDIVVADSDYTSKLTPKKKRKSMPRKTIAQEQEGNEADEDVTEAWKKDDKRGVESNPKAARVIPKPSKHIVHFEFAESMVSSKLVGPLSIEKTSLQPIESTNIIVLTELQPLSTQTI